MAYQRHYWKDYDENKTETQNIEDGAVVTTEKLNEMEAGIVSKVDATDFDNLKDNINSEISKNLFDNSKALNDIRKKQNTNKLYTDNFVLDLVDWDTTKGWSVNGQNLNLGVEASEPAHLQIALFDKVEDAKSIEIKLGENPTKARICFAENFRTFVYVTLGPDGNSFSMYRVERGKLDTSVISIPISPTQSWSIGTRIKIVRHNQVLQFFVNDIYVGLFRLRDATDYILPMGKVKAGVTARDYDNTYKVSQTKVYPKQQKYVHFSIDDVLSILQSVNSNASTYASLFDHPTFAFLKETHEKYGAVFSLFLFYMNDSFDLSQMTSKFKEEFRKNADWLKLGFHAYDTNAKYGNGGFDTETAKIHYSSIITQIRRFAHPYCIDEMPRIGFFSGTLSTCKALKDLEGGIRGALTADDDRNENMYLNSSQRETLVYCDEYKDTVNQLYFVRTDMRLEQQVDPVSVLESRKTNRIFNGQQDILEIFTHENYAINNSTQIKFTAISEWAINNGYVFDFPMNNLPKY